MPKMKGSLMGDPQTVLSVGSPLQRRPLVLDPCLYSRVGAIHAEAHAIDLIIRILHVEDHLTVDGFPPAGAVGTKPLAINLPVEESLDTTHFGVVPDVL